MNAKTKHEDGWISSLEVIAKTGISRATLNNYIKMDLLPRPSVRRPENSSVRARMLGYFPEFVIDTINHIKELKKKGFSMENIAERLTSKKTSTGETSLKTVSKKEDTKNELSGNTYSGIEQNDTNSLNVTINDITFPAYLVNYNYEIDWINEDAEKIIFDQKIRSIEEPKNRNIFMILMRNFHISKQTKQDLMEFHLRFVKEKREKSELSNLYEDISSREKEHFEEIYDQIEPANRQSVHKMHLNLLNDNEESVSDCVYYLIFREGILFIHALDQNSIQEVTNLLSCRSKVINDLLKQRMPTLVSFGVLVADLQNSCGISAVLPSDEYFELIHQIWTCVEGSFKKYYGTYGKHAGDGMLYYFLKERDNQYLINAISCALEIRENIKNLNMEWKARKGWFNDICLNIGINEGQEYFGTIPSAPSIEFTALGDTVNNAGRLSDFAREGRIWTTKNLLNKLSTEEKENFRYGIRHRDNEREMLVENTFGRIMDMRDLEAAIRGKFRDISTLAITEIVGTK
ncbi:adenylate/guanylate cyclase domain-containing protein [Thermodesulfobacteriota bacterium]